MPYVVWEDSYSVKVNEIDAQHQEFIGYINELCDAMNKGQSKAILHDLLKKLANFASHHFQVEEKYMQEFHYPDYETHKIEHTKFLNKITQFKKDYESSKHFVSVEIIAFLKDWFVNHVLIVDQKYSALFIQKGLK